jgi:hypothetical protein
MLVLYITIVLHVKKGWDKCPNNELHSMSPNGKKDRWKNEAKMRTYQKQKSSGGLLMRIWLGMTQRMLLCPSPKKGTPIHPRLKRTGLSGPLTVTGLFFVASIRTEFC